MILGNLGKKMVILHETLLLSEKKMLYFNVSALPLPLPLPFK